MDDAISHMSCRADFVAALRTAYDHLNPGGVLVVTPDVTIETFQQNRTTVTPATRDGLDGSLRIETEHWTMGLFSLDTRCSPA